MNFTTIRKVLVLGFFCMVLGLSPWLKTAQAGARAAKRAEIQMLSVASSYPSGYQGKIVALPEEDGTGDLKSFRFTDSRGTTLNYTADELAKGVVLLQAFGKDIITIQGKKFDPHTGGPMDITFLRRFFSNDRRQATVDYTRASGASEWELRTDDAQGHDSFDTVWVEVVTSFGVPNGVDRFVLKEGISIERSYDAADLPHANTGRHRRPRPVSSFAGL